MTIKYDKGKEEYKNWIIEETDFELENLNKFESVFALGNGYLGLRSSLEEKYITEWRGAYLAGLFDQFPGEVTELPNLPDPLLTEIKIDGERVDLSCVEVEAYSRDLNLKTGELNRSFIWEDSRGRKTKFEWKRFVSMAEKHLIMLKVNITPLNYEGEVEIISYLNGQVTNSGVQHFIEKDLRFIKEKNLYYLTARTQESQCDLAAAARHEFYKNGEKIETEAEIKTDRRKISRKHTINVKADQSYSFEKKVFYISSVDQELDSKAEKKTSAKLHQRIIKLVEKYAAADYDQLFKKHAEKWADYWEEMDIKISGNDFDQLAIRFALFHLIQMTPHHTDKLSIAAKGLTGEGYRGHVFWDMETFILPFFIYSFPEKAKELLEYRYHTIAGARKKARQNGYQGAMYAWESALTGEETTPKYGAVDVKTGEAIRIWCGEIEQHITADIAKAVFEYLKVTGDYSFIEDYGAEMLTEMARFWVSRLEYNKDKDYYEIKNVIGPDEYSEYIDNNAYTNYMVYWELINTADLIEELKEKSKAVYQKLKDKINLEFEEINKWRQYAEKIKLPEPDKDLIIPQFDEFMEKKEYDLSKFEGEVGSIVSELGWEEVNEYKIIKQADVVMLMHQLSEYFDDQTKRANYEYYEPKTLHDSSLSPAIHSVLAAKFDHLEEAYKLFSKGARIDLGENMKSSDPGLHSASLGGLWQAVIHGFAGIDVEADELKVEPNLPVEWDRLEFKIYFKGEEYLIKINEDQTEIKNLSE
jgi:trehalose/maltose hydrolase-like predicted phosphorylase